MIFTTTFIASCEVSTTVPHTIPRMWPALPLKDIIAAAACIDHTGIAAAAVTKLVFFDASGRKEFRLYSPRLCELLRTQGMAKPLSAPSVHPNGLISYIRGIREDGEDSALSG